MLAAGKAGAAARLEAARALHVQRLNLTEQVRLSQLAGELAKVGYWRLDVATSEIRWSEEMFRMFGLAPGPEPALEDAMVMVHPDDQALADACLATALATGEGYSSLTRLVWRTGEVRTIEGRTICELGDGGEVV